MTNDTKQLFDAPWKSVEMVDTNFPYLHECEIVSNNGNGHTIATEVLRTDANRLARLPELYDALMDSVFKFCESCLVKRGMLDEEHPDYDLIKHGCPNRTGKSRVVSCVAMKWIELLQKVRDGE